MRSSSDHILTSHAGSLPRPDALIEAWVANDESALQNQLGDAVVDVVRHQREIGIDIPGDGEFGKPMGQRVNYGSWWRYSWQRLAGIEPGGQTLYEMEARRSRPGGIVLTSFGDRRDRALFAAAYNDPESGITTGPRPSSPVCTGPLRYSGQEMIRADIARFKTALAAAGIEEGFMTAVAPASCARIANKHYKSDEEFLYACADAMSEEYKAIVDAGIFLQLDDPCLAEGWDQVNPEPSISDYQKLAATWIDALNHAIRGLSKNRIRLHLCWGSWHGPHVTDIPIRDIIEIVLKAEVGAVSFEAGNVRHEHEWKVWQEVKLPDDKLMLPGVVSHATNVVEHPELVADRILRFAELVGRERVIASTDCGLGGRVHPDIAWAKLETLAQGAALASKQLWR
ncbi:MAG: cobalamin-independent methionine synthase II family protein [Alphaproteobacteria bacterium]|nr:cobalamin-independent methionine synthase II family protein [Alphaproteobacteria bacterium]